MANDGKVYLPQNMDEVSQRFGRIKDSLSGYNRNDQNELWKDTINRLEDLKKIVNAQEQKFYEQLNAKSVEDIQSRINELNNDIGFKNMTSGIGDIKKYIEVAQAPGEKTILEQVFANNADKVLTKIQQETLNNLDGNVIIESTDLIKMLNQISNEKYGDQARRINAGTGKRGLLKSVAQVKLTRTINGIDVTINQKDGGFLTKDWVDRIGNILEDEYKPKTESDKRALVDALKLELMKEINNETILKAVLYQIENNYDKYDINLSDASIRGWLGEVKAAAILNVLMNQQGKIDTSAFGTGNLRSIANNFTKGAEIPIDIVFGAFNFQIKNYTLINNQATFGKRGDETMGMGSYIINRLRPQDTILNLLLELYSMLPYNIPYANNVNNMLLNQYKAEVYDPMHKYAMDASDGTALKQLFDSYIDNVLKISDVFKTDDPLFASEKAEGDLFFNTFFLISDRLVPSSHIIQSIIDSLKIADTQSRYIWSQYKLTMPDPQNTIQNKPNYGADIANMTKMANQVKMNYQIKLNIQEILTNAARFVKN